MIEVFYELEAEGRRRGREYGEVNLEIGGGWQYSHPNLHIQTVFS